MGQYKFLLIPYYTLTIAVGGQVYTFQAHNEGFYIFFGFLVVVGIVLVQGV